MTHDEAFLQEIVDNPDDDTPRLIFADWLDEHDQSDRADFIRVQCALARMPPDDPRRFDLEEREGELLAERGDAWAAPLPGLNIHCAFRRGFVDSLVLLGVQFLEHREELLQRFPVRHVHFQGTFDQAMIEALAGCDLLGRLAGLGLSGVYVPRPANWRALFSSARLSGLRVLNVSNARLAPEDLHALTASAHLARLRVFDLSNNPQLSGAATRNLAAWPQLSELDALRLDNLDLDDAAVARLVASPHLGRLQTLGLVRNPRIGRAGFHALAHAPALASLRHLDLSHNWIAAREVQALASSPVWKQLTSLDLSYSGGLRPEGVQVLAASPTFATLTSLELRATFASPAGAQALAGSPHLRRLTRLTLADNHIKDEGARWLADAPLLETLTVLKLDNNSLGTAGAQSLAASSRARQLTTLEIRGNRIGGEGAEAILASANLPALRLLLLGENGISPKFMHTLRRAHGRRVRYS
jgi:uncharacterized protein (TIGR02996 family)